MYKQLNASFGAFDMAILRLSTKALASGSVGDDSTYTTLEAQITDWTAQRDALAGQIKEALNGADFGGVPISQRTAQWLSTRAQTLISEAEDAAASS